MPTDWYPDALADRIPWHANFAAQATALGVTRGLTAAQIGLDSTAVAGLLNYGETADAFKQAVTAFRDAYLEGIATALVPPAPTAPSRSFPATTTSIPTGVRRARRPPSASPAPIWTRSRRRPPRAPTRTGSSRR